MKVGDLVKWESIMTDDMDRYSVYGYGIILRLSRTGHNSFSAEVKWTDGHIDWIDSERLVVVNEARR